MNRDDFLMLEQDIIYLDNGATTLKPKVLTETLADYYNNYSANAHRGDYDISLRVDQAYEGAREKVQKFLKASDKREIVFTSGTTDAMNKIIFGYYKNHLKPGDEVIISRSEHASNVLPWFELKDQIGIKVKYVTLDADYKVSLDAIKQIVTEKTRVIALAWVTNVIGDVRPIDEIASFAHENNIQIVVDAAQAAPHMDIDVKNIDFLALSAHKMCGPTGVGILYGKLPLLKETRPIIFGGGMNASFDEATNRVYNDPPHCFEAGTPNIAGVIAFGAIIDYLNNIGMAKIHEYEQELRAYALKELKQIKELKIYNENSEGGIIAFNYEGIFAQDLAIYLNKFNICVRAGNHCAKILKNEIGVKNTCRASFYFYNNKQEVDALVNALKNPNIKNEII